jgi:hypothetical protein
MTTRRTALTRPAARGYLRNSMKRVLRILTQLSESLFGTQLAESFPWARVAESAGPRARSASFYWRARFTWCSASTRVLALVIVTSSCSSSAIAATCDGLSDCTANPSDSQTYYNRINGIGSNPKVSGMFGALSPTNSVTNADTLNNAVVFEDAPAWMRWLGDASESDPNGNVSLQGVHYYGNFTIPSGSTLTISNTASTTSNSADIPQGAAVIFATGTCTIAGTVAGNGLNSSLVGNGGGAGGGGGGAQATNAGVVGKGSQFFGPGGTVVLAAAGALGAVGAAGGNGLTPSASAIKYLAQWVMGSGQPMGAPGGAGGNGTSSGGTGGSGGGSLVLVCGTISYPATGAINLNGSAGGNGVAGANNSGGGGGGGGGFVLMAARSYSSNTGTTNVSGGIGGSAGGAGAGTGGTGGNGWSKQFTLN